MFSGQRFAIFFPARPHIQGVIYILSFRKKLDKVVELVGEGSAINGSYPVSSCKIFELKDDVMNETRLRQSVPNSFS